MCCGQKRSQIQNHLPQRKYALATNRQPASPIKGAASPQPRAQPPTQVVQPVSAPENSILLSYLETAPVRVRGLATGRTYEFSGSQPVRNVDVRDASSLLNTRFFKRG